jgi:hypothetical protein
MRSLTVLASVIAIAACSPGVFDETADDDGVDADAGVPGKMEGPDATVTDAASSLGDGSIVGEVGVTPDAGADADACAPANAGIGASCTTDMNCTCGTVCAALKCVPRSKCDEGLLTWDGPVARTDGQCLENLEGFKVYWGTTAGGPYEHALNVGIPCANGASLPCGDAGGSVAELKCSYRVTALDAGTWYFTVSAYSDAGEESTTAAEVSKNVACP